jgi:hypothetical protein
MLAGLIFGLLSDSSGESDKDLYYSLTFLDFICNYCRDGDDDDFQQVNAQYDSLVASQTFFTLFLL